MKTHVPERVINSIASFLSTTTGFLITFVALLVGIGIGAFLQFNDAFMFGFNILLSVAAIVISGIISPVVPAVKPRCTSSSTT